MSFDAHNNSIDILYRSSSDATDEEKKRKEELTPEGSYDEDDISIYYDFTDEDTAEIPSFFNHMKEMFQYKVNYYNNLTYI